MYSLNNGRDAGSEYRIINRSGIAFYFVFIYRSNPTFPLFKNRFSDNLRLFKRQIVPIRIRNRFDFSTGSLSLSVYPYTVGGASHGRGPYGRNVHGTMRVASSRWDARSFIFPPLSSLARSLISVIEHRTRRRSRCSAHGMERVLFLRVRDRTPSHPLFFAPLFPPPLLGLVSPMYANPVYELAKCTRKCIRRTINCRSSLEEVLRKLWQVGRN